VVGRHCLAIQTLVGKRQTGKPSFHQAIARMY
jgi:hypothetical protein